MKKEFDPQRPQKVRQSLVADHEEKLPKILNLMLYGIAERRTKK